MTDHALPSPLDVPFATLCGGPGAGYGAMLVAVEREFRTVDPAAADARLDDLARPLFELAAAPADERAGGLAMAAHLALPRDGAGPEAWMALAALEGARAAAPVRAALAAELGRRAGWPAAAFRHRDRWFVMCRDERGRFVADAGPAPLPAPLCDRDASGSACAHGVAFEVLTGLAAAWLEAGDGPRARRAAGLRLLLPLDRRLHADLRRDLRRFGG